MYMFIAEFVAAAAAELASAKSRFRKCTFKDSREKQHCGGSRRVKNNTNNQNKIHDGIATRAYVALVVAGAATDGDSSSSHTKIEHG